MCRIRKYSTEYSRPYLGKRKDDLQTVFCVCDTNNQEAVGVVCLQTFVVSQSFD